jgi:chorismate synthase
MGRVLRWITAGESHGRALVAVVEGMVAGVGVTSGDIAWQLKRRRLGYGRGARMKFEADEVTVLAGVRHGITLGGPIAIEIGNTEWPKWETVMASDPVDAAELDVARNAPLTRPRPGHADYAGMLKYGFDDARPVLERASARETAARVAAGTVARAFLREALGVEVLSHVISIGASKPYDGPPPRPADLDRIDDSPVRAFDEAAEQSMIAEIEAAKKDGDTLGGVVEVVVEGLPIGLGSFTSGDNRLDSQLAAAVMGIQAIKGVEIGDGFETARRRGSVAHDEIYPGPGGVMRSTNRAGGLEGGMTNGQPLRVRAAMKPISTVPRALATIDMATGEEAVAIHQRSDVCAVPAAGVVVETMVALVLARAALEKFGGDSLAETRANVETYLRAVAARDPASGGQERSDRGISSGGQERSDRGISSGGQERDRGINSAQASS